jgi:hypothetical protein
MVIPLVRLFAPLAALLLGTVQAQVRNGFDLTGASVPAERIEAGGPPRDGIPAIDRPRFVSAPAARLRPEERVLGVALDGLAKAYPIRILNWHEIVNDRFGTEPVVVSYCPLCGSGIAFRATVRGGPASFGVSGLLYNSDVLLYDRETNSLWSQIAAEAISGPRKGERLAALPTANTTWAEWRARHPHSQVLSEDTGHARDYRRDPYAGYERSAALYFQVAATDGRYHPKEMVLGVESGGRYKAYAFCELEKAPVPLRDTLGGDALEIRFDRAHRTAVVRDAKGAERFGLLTYWFAWYAFHPDTEVFRAPSPRAIRSATRCR